MSLKKRDNHETHDESYFASFTDLLVGILFIFIILLMVVATNYRKQQKYAENATEVLTAINNSRNASLEDIKKSLEEMENATEVLTAINNSRNIVLENIKKSLEEMGLEVIIDLQSGILRLPENLLFASGQSEVSYQGVEALGKLSKVLIKFLPCLSKSDESLKEFCKNLEIKNGVFLETVLIEGHTDDIKFGSDDGFDSNWGLSARRSITVYQKLINFAPLLETGILNNDEKPIFGVSAYEAKRPIKANIDNESRKSNRRIDLRFVMRSPSAEEIEKLKILIKDGDTKKQNTISE